jgi:acyl-CoA thioesterase FadM
VTRPHLSSIPRPSITPDVPSQAAFFAIEILPEELSEVIDHVRNTEYLRWLDRGAQLHLEQMGWSYDDLIRSHRLFFVARHEVDYLNEILSEDRIVLATWVRDVRRVKSWRDSILFRQEKDGTTTEVCRAATLWVHVDLDSRRPVSISPEMVVAMQPSQQEQPRSRRACT